LFTLEAVKVPARTFNASVADQVADQRITPGGIDLTPAHMNLQTQNLGGRIKFHMDTSMLKQLQDASGFEPVIVSIQPMVNLKIFLGLKNRDEKVASV